MKILFSTSFVLPFIIALFFFHHPLAYSAESDSEAVDLAIKSDNHPLNTLVIRRLKIDRADPAVS